MGTALHTVSSPLSMAALPRCGNCVRVGPPWLASGPSRMGTSRPCWSPLAVKPHDVSLARLCPPLALFGKPAPKQLAPDDASKFTMVLVSLSTPEAKYKLWAVPDSTTRLSRVTLTSVATPAFSIPPPSAAELPLSVELLRFNPAVL